MSRKIKCPVCGKPALYRRERGEEGSDFETAYVHEEERKGDGGFMQSVCKLADERLKAAFGVNKLLQSEVFALHMAVKAGDAAEAQAAHENVVQLAGKLLELAVTND